LKTDASFGVSMTKAAEFASGSLYRFNDVGRRSRALE
jgi:hypothetical protein